MTNPARFHKNVPGDFYTTGCEDCGDCLSCEEPEYEAPTLLAPQGGPSENCDTYFIRQPVTPEEVEAACRALLSCCVGALRYGGKDAEIIARLGNGPSYCDFIQTDRGTLIPTLNPTGGYRKELRKKVRRERTARRNRFRAKVDGERVTWHLAWKEPGAKLNPPMFRFWPRFAKRAHLFFHMRKHARKHSVKGFHQ